MKAAQQLLIEIKLKAALQEAGITGQKKTTYTVKVTRSQSTKLHNEIGRMFKSLGRI
jgi:hypothetical protein